MSDDPDCVGMCAIDDDVCTGCGRTLDQINKARGGEDEESPPSQQQAGLAAPLAGKKDHADRFSPRK